MWSEPLAGYKLAAGGGRELAASPLTHTHPALSLLTLHSNALGGGAVGLGDVTQEEGRRYS